jgi:hypothetical protein
MSNSLFRVLSGAIGFRRASDRAPGPARAARIGAASAGVTAEPLEARRLFALDVTPFDPAATPASLLANELLLPGTGITITGSSFVGQPAQAGTYT